MGEKSLEMSPEKMEKIKESMTKYKDEIVSHFKDMNVEVKDWRFAMEKTSDGHLVDASIKLILRSSKPESVSQPIS